MRTSTQLAGTALAALLALTACGGDTEADAENTDEAATEQPTDADGPAAEEQDAAAEEPESRDDGLNPEAMDLVERENEVFERFLDAVGTEEEAEVQSELEEIYDELDELYPDIESVEDLPPELQMLGFLQYLVDRGVSIDELIGDSSTGQTTDPIDAELGETLDVDQGPFVDEGDYVGTLTLNDITRDFQGEGCEEPTNGEFVALDITIDAHEDVSDVFSVSEGDFYVIDENDTMLRNEIVSYEGWLCADRNGSLQYAQPGTNTTGLVVLDMPAGQTGTLVYAGGVHDIRWDL
ncbi:hypothetical protein [Nesterenkonia sp. HG001]|uniref:hypothetical protein n=1 Tax=Nesterenkonia sp. HG001 TaxID=2983207 RepID=UPI002AC6DF6A|nr:hypothetical protein [Nesterenkonia sp. HG001]MDZ5076792.1 hypothetical protein [Nesterenkonia sp. HG001]